MKSLTFSRDNLDSALYEAESAVTHLRDALDAFEDLPEGISTRSAMRVERLILVSKSILNNDGVFTSYDFALAIREVEA